MIQMIRRVVRRRVRSAAREPGCGRRRLASVIEILNLNGRMRAMNKSRIFAAVVLIGLIVLLIRVREARAQQAAAAPPPPAAAEMPAPTASGTQTPLKVQLMISEYSGTQKLLSLPYTIYVVDSGPHANSSASVRMDTRVPIHETYTQANGSSSSGVQYQDVGTNIDCRLVTPTGNDGRYHFTFNVQRSSLISSTGADIKQGDLIPVGEPLIRSFQDSFDVVLRDGQTLEGSSSVDPTTGNVMKVDVTLNVEK